MERKGWSLKTVQSLDSTRVISSGQPVSQPYAFKTCLTMSTCSFLLFLNPYDSKMLYHYIKAQCQDRMRYFTELFHVSRYHASYHTLQCFLNQLTILPPHYPSDVFPRISFFHTSCSQPKKLFICLLAVSEELIIKKFIEN